MKKSPKINVTQKFRSNNLLSLYYHSSYLEYYKMKNDILSKVKTKFVMLCDNDDFIYQVA